MNTADNELSFNDLPKAVTRILSDVGDIKQLLTEMRHRQERTKPADHHVPMTVDEAAEYLTLPKNTLYDKLAKGEIPATKPGKRYVLYKDELDKWLECSCTDDRRGKEQCDTGIQPPQAEIQIMEKR